MKELIYIFLGGGIGSTLRFIVSMLYKHLSLHPRFVGMVFPWPTFIVNILGCLMIGFFYQYSERWGMSSEMRLFLTTGLCGGFTTFSTFSYEGIALLNEGYYIVFALYFISSIALGLLAVLLPMMLLD